MTSSVVLDGSSTVTGLASTAGAAGERSSCLAPTATAVDLTSCASVSRLMSPFVRPPDALASVPAGETSTDAADRYTFGWLLVTTTRRRRRARGRGRGSTNAGGASQRTGTGRLTPDESHPW